MLNASSQLNVVTETATSTRQNCKTHDRLPVTFCWPWICTCPGRFCICSCRICCDCSVVFPATTVHRLNKLMTSLTVVTAWCTSQIKIKVKTSTSVKGTDVLSTHADPTERHISSVKFTSAHLYSNVYIPVGVARMLADSSDFGLLGEQSSQKSVIPCLGRQ